MGSVIINCVSSHRLRRQGIKEEIVNRPNGTNHNDHEDERRNGNRLDQGRAMEQIRRRLVSNCIQFFLRNVGGKSLTGIRHII